MNRKEKKISKDMYQMDRYINHMYGKCNNLTVYTVIDILKRFTDCDPYSEQNLDHIYSIILSKSRIHFKNEYLIEKYCWHNTKREFDFLIRKRILKIRMKKGRL